MPLSPLALLTALFLLCSCYGKKSGLEFLETASEKEEATSFALIKSQILEPHCLGCHKSATSEEALLKKWVVPGDPEHSPFFLTVQSGAMPKKAQPLGPEKLELIRSYILELPPLERIVEESLPEGKAPTFEALSSQVLVPKNCVACHAEARSQEELISWISPQSPEESPLYVRVLDRSMPFKGVPLSDGELELVLRYVEGFRKKDLTQP